MIWGRGDLKNYIHGTMFKEFANFSYHQIPHFMCIYIYNWDSSRENCLSRIYIYKVIKMIHFEIAKSPEP